MAILNKYKKKWQSSLLLRKDNYFDLVLSHDNTPTIPLDCELTKQCLSSYINMNNPVCIDDNDAISSDGTYQYKDSENTGVELKNIGFTGIDTSLITFDKDKITQDEFADLIQKSTLPIDSGDTRLHLSPVSGNTKLYEYPCEIVSEGSGDTYYKLTGGFLQGFYKLCGDYNYSVLPQHINGGWNLEFVIRPRTDYAVTGNTINTIYPNNSGIFFYMGARAENKFIEYYGGEELNKYPLRNVSSETSGSTTGKTPVLLTSEQHVAESGLEYDIVTDNGYLIYNRTCDGETTDTWPQGGTIILGEENRDVKHNLYTVMNRTCSGYTTDTWSKYLEEHPEEYVNKKTDVLKDIINNAFALKVNEDFSIGYKYLVKDCDGDSGYKIEEENGFPGAIVENRWNIINVMFKILNGEVDDCGNPLGERKMRMFIYINGYLKFVSKELPEFNFRELNDFCDKQEGVAFNLSLGGGTQGLMESVWFNKMTGSKHIFPLEQNFAGSFIGDIRSFKFYDCALQYNQIVNNYFFEIKNEITPIPDMVKNNILYYGFDISYEHVITNGVQKPATKELRSKYTTTSEYDDAHFYVVIAKNYIGTKPLQFTCGGAPMVMNEIETTIYNTPCIVYESGEIYAPGTELLILSDNF